GACGWFSKVRLQNLYERINRPVQCEICARSLPCPSPEALSKRTVFQKGPHCISEVVCTAWVNDEAALPVNDELFRSSCCCCYGWLTCERPFDSSHTERFRKRRDRHKHTPRILPRKVLIPHMR